MLLVVKKGREAEVEAIFEKWDLHAAHIGDVTDDGLLRVKDHGDGRRRDSEHGARRRGARLRPADRAAGVPRRGRDSSTSSALPSGAAAATRCWRSSRRRRSPASAGSTGSTTTWCAPTRSCSPGMGAGVVRVKGTTRALAMSTDGNGRYCYLDPRRGAMLAVAEAARNVACAGGAADRRDQLPELRQPRAARDHVAVRRGGRRHRRSLPRARHSDHRRQRQPLQRDRRPGDLSRRRSSASSA